jgi:hypothetical protein
MERNPTYRELGGRLPPLARQSATVYPITVPPRTRRWRVALILLACGVILLFASGRRLQIGFSLRSAQAVDAQQLEAVVNSPNGRYANLFSGVFYAGSDDRGDYFVIPLGTKNVGVFQVFKTKLGAIAVPHTARLTSDESKWLDVTKAFPLPR